MDTKKLKMFLDVVDTKDFAQTGRNLFISRSAVLQQITKLERNLGVKLFNRTTHSVSLTEAGAELVPLAQEIVQTADKIVQVMHNYSKTITVGTIFMQKPVLFTEYWNLVKAKFPNVNVKFQELHNIKEINNQIDLIEYYEINKFLDNSFKFKPLRNESIVIGVPESNPLAKKAFINIKDLIPYEIAVESEGISDVGDKVLHYIRNKFPNMRIKSYGVYNSSFFTTAQFNQQLIIASSGMAQFMYPYKVKKLKLDIDVHALYGFYYRKNTSKPVMNFINEIDC